MDRNLTAQSRAGQQLVLGYLESHDHNLKERIYANYYNLIYSTAQQYAQYAELEDLLSEGTIGLLCALERYSLDKRIAFTTFASYYIRGRMQNYIRDKALTIRRSSGLYNKDVQYNKFVIAFEGDHGRYPTVEEIMRGLKMGLYQAESLYNYHTKERLAFYTASSPVGGDGAPEPRTPDRLRAGLDGSCGNGSEFDDLLLELKCIRAKNRTPSVVSARLGISYTKAKELLLEVCHML